MVPPDDFYVVPELQVLRGTITSMFEFSAQQNKLLSSPEAGVYFHKSTVSFPSDRARQRWLAGATEHLDRCSDPSPSQDPIMRGGAIDVNEMESADLYCSFLNEARRSGTMIWTGLFFTYDQSWHYWGAVLKHNPAHGLVNIYVLPLEIAKHRILPSQRKFQRACRAYYRKVRMHFHTWGKYTDIDAAFGWTIIWGRIDAAALP
jgi:hypothetical protein